MILHLHRLMGSSATPHDKERKMSTLSKFLEVRKNYIWAKMLLSALISGGATGLAGAVTIPGANLKSVLFAAFVAGVAGAAMYLKRSPMPEEVGDASES